MVVPAQGKALIPTDISIAVPVGTYGRVAPRSGLAVKHFLDVGAGVVDADYRGPLGVVLFNFSKQDYQGSRYCGCLGVTDLCSHKGRSHCSTGH
jgi:dUTP pyrophosphatase